MVVALFVDVSVPLCVCVVVAWAQKKRPAIAHQAMEEKITKFPAGLFFETK
jgi:hypothetical protein